MKKAILLPLALFVITLSAAGQNANQQALLESFYKRAGTDVIAGWAHPANSYYPAKTEVDLHPLSRSIDVTIFFEGSLVDYSSTYTIYYNPQGDATNMAVKVEGNLLQNSFKTCENAGESISGKAVSCKDLCLLALKTYWSAKGYKSSY